MTVLVTGATGTIGGPLVRELSSAGLDVRAAVRSGDRAAVLGDLAASAVEVDLNDPAAVDRAVEGTDQVVLITANSERQVQQESAVIDAAARHGVSHLVKVSVGGAAPDAPLALARDHYLAEQQLRSSSVPASLIRPGFVMQNLLQYAGWIEKDGTWRLPFGAGAMAMVDARDVASGIAAVLVRAVPSAWNEYGWTGPQSLDLSAAATIIGAAAQRPIHYVDGSGEEFYEHYVADGHAPGYARDITTLYDQIVRAGWVAAVVPGLEDLLGRAPRTLADFARDYATSFAAEPLSH